MYNVSLSTIVLNIVGIDTKIYVHVHIIDHQV